MGYTTKMVCLQALLILCILSSVNGHCAEFQFTGISNSEAFTATEGVRFKLPFSLNIGGCQDNQTDYTITVSKSNTQSNIDIDVCKMLINSTGTCFSFRPDCVCEKEEGNYSVSKIADRSDATSWTLKVNKEWIAADYNIDINVNDSPSTKHPTTSVKTSHTTLGPMTTGTQAPVLPQIIQLSLDNSTSSQIVEVNSSVDILCAYRKGDYPNGEVILRNATGTKLTAKIPAADQHGHNTIKARYTMESVGCEDSGEISCELPKARRSATATLLVKCPPRYTEGVVKIFPGIEGDPMELRFQLITHTQEISGCNVTKVSQGHHEDLGHNKTHTDKAPGATEFQECRQFASGYKILGTLPQGTLQMKLDRLSQDHNGTWRVTISNEAGSASFNFKLEITEAKKSASNNGYVAGAGVVIAVIIIVIAVVVIVVMLVRYKEQAREMMQRYIR